MPFEQAVIAIVFVLGFPIYACVITVILLVSRKSRHSRNDKLLRFLKYLRSERRISEQEYFEVSGEHNKGAAASTSIGQPAVPAEAALQGQVPVQTPAVAQAVLQSPTPAMPPATAQATTQATAQATATAPGMVQMPAPAQSPFQTPLQSRFLSPNHAQVPAPPKLQAKPAIKPDAKSFGAIIIVLIIGVIFVILSGLIFATTTWVYLSNVVRIFMIFSFSFVFFGASIVAEKVFRIRKTAVAFYTLGSLFLPICILATGFFRLFGDWFSLSGGGRYLLYMTTALLLGTASFIGSMKYRYTYFSACFLLCITGAVLFAVKSMYLPYDIFILIMFIYCAVITFASQWLAKRESLEPDFGHIVSILQLFTVLNVSAIGVIGLLTTGTGLLPGISAILLGALFLRGLFQQKDRYWGVLAYAVFLTAGFMKWNISGDFSNSFILAAISCAVIVLCGMMNVFPAPMKKWISIVGGIWACAVFVWQFAYIVVGQEKWTLLYLLGIAVLLANVIWVAVLQKSKIFMSAMPFVAAVLIIGFCDYLSLTTFPTGIIMTLLAAAVFAIVFLLDKRSKSFSPRTTASDIIFPVICMAGGLVDMLVDGLGAAAVSANSPLFASASLLSFLILITISLILTVERKRSAAGWIFAYALPHFLLLLILPGQIYYAAQTNIFTLLLVLYGIIASAGAAGIILESRHESWKRIKLPFAIATVLYGLLVPLVELMEGSSKLYLVHLWVLAAYLFLCLFVSIRTTQRKTKKYEMSMLYYASGAGFFLAIIASAFALLPSAAYSQIFLIPAAEAVMMFALYILLKYSGKVSRENLRDFYNVVRVSLHVFAVIIVFLFLYDQSVVPGFVAAVVILLAVCLTSLYVERNTAAGLIGFLLFYIVMFAVFDKLAVLPGSVSYIVGFIWVFAGMAIAGRLLHHDVFSWEVQSEGKKTAYIDWFTIVNVVGAAALLLSGDKTGAFWGSILLAIYAMTLFRRVKTGDTDDVLLTVTAASCCLAYWLQPFFTFPDLLSVELNLVPIILFFVILNKFLWRKAVAVTGLLLYMTSCLCLAGLAIAAVMSGEVFDAIIIGIISLLLFAGSFLKKSKRWFVLSALTLIILAIYMSRSFWQSVAWWGYLLITGLGLIALAAANEASKQNGSSLSQKVSEAFEDWKL